MIRMIGVSLLLFAGAAAAQTAVINVAGTQAERMGSCVPPFAYFGGNDCSYDDSDPTGMGPFWIGPATGGTTYITGTSVPYPVPVSGTVEIANNVSGCDRDATLAITLQLAAATLRSQAGPSSTVQETWGNGDLRYSIAATPVTLAMPNEAGGCDYEIASIGVPPRLKSRSGNALYPLASGAYLAPAKFGIASFENNPTQGTTATVGLGPTYSCSATSASLCNTDPASTIFGANFGKEHSVFENVLVSISTDAASNITSATIFANSEYLIPVFDPQPLNSWNGFLLTFTGTCTEGCTHAVPPALKRTSVYCPGDLDADNVADVAMLTASGLLRVRNFAGQQLVRENIPQFTGAQRHRLTGLAFLPDTNASGKSEIALLGLGAGTVDIKLRELQLSGGFLAPINLESQQLPIDLEIVADQNANSAPELASLDWDGVTVQMTDVVTRAVIRDVAFSTFLEPVDLEVFPDLDGDSRPELAVLAGNSGAFSGAYSPAGYSDKLEVRSSSTGVAVGGRFFAKNWRVLQQELLADTNDNGFPDVAVLLLSHIDKSVQVAILDIATLQTLRVLPFGTAAAHPPKRLLTIADINGNGSDEVVVFGRHVKGLDQKARIVDSATSQAINTVFYDKNFVGEDVAACPDADNNGAPEIVMLGRRASDGLYRAIVRDSATDALNARIDF